MKFLRQLGTMAAARGIEVLVQALLLILLARELGPVLFGVVAVYHAVHSVAFIVAGMNTATFVVREEALGRRDLAYGALRTNAIVVTCALGLVLCGTLIVVGQPLIAFAVAANAAGAWSQQLSDNRLSLSLAHRVVWVAFITTVVRATSSLAVFLTLVLLAADAALAFGIARMTAVVLSLMLATLLVHVDGHTAPASARTVFRLQLPLALPPAVAALRQLDTVIVTAISGLSAAGLYSAAVRVVSPLVLFSAAVNPIIVPRVASAASQKIIKLYDALFVALLLCTALPLALWPVAERIVIGVFGPDFAGGGAVLIWALLRVGEMTFGPVLAGVLQARRFDRVVAVNATIFTIAMILATIVGALLLGAVGAAAGVALVGLAGRIRLWAVGRKMLRDHDNLDDGGGAA